MGWNPPPYDLDDDALTVCVTHNRFIPCRFDNGCVMSQEASDVARVHHHHSSDEWKP